jgi:hypothetical protein
MIFEKSSVGIAGCLVTASRVSLRPVKEMEEKRSEGRREAKGRVERERAAGAQE